jgi:hypothetical protein
MTLPLAEVAEPAAVHVTPLKVNFKTAVLFAT